MPTVSVVVPNYNHAQFLRQRMDTILAQTYHDFELILLDDRSTDESREILSEYTSNPRARLEFNETNSGSTYKQWNKGVRLAQGEYVWIAESDDYADPRFLERLAVVLDSDPAIAFAYCRSWIVDEKGVVGGLCSGELDQARLAADYCADGREECRQGLVHENVVANASAVLFRKSLYFEAGGADESLRLCGDWKLWCAMALTGKVAFVAEPLNYFRCHGSSVRSRTQRARTDALECLHVSRWLLDRVSVSDSALERICDVRLRMWVPALLSFRVPLAQKWEIVRAVRALDPHPVCRAARPALTEVRLKLRRHWRGFSSMVTRGRYASR